MHPMFETLRSMLKGKWSPPTGRNWFNGWLEFGAAVHAVHLLTHESLARAAAETAVADCNSENRERNDAVKARIYNDAERQAYKDRDFCDADKWTKYKAWVEGGAFDYVPDIVNAFETAAAHRTGTDIGNVGDKLKALISLLQSLPTPPGHTLKKDRDRQQREAAAASVAAIENADGDDRLDADFGEVHYEPNPAAVSSAVSSALAAAAAAPPVDDDETGDEGDGRDSPVYDFSGAEHLVPVAAPAAVGGIPAEDAYEPGIDLLADDEAEQARRRAVYLDPPGSDPAYMTPDAAPSFQGKFLPGKFFTWWLGDPLKFYPEVEDPRHPRCDFWFISCDGLWGKTLGYPSSREEKDLAWKYLEASTLYVARISVAAQRAKAAASFGMPPGQEANNDMLPHIDDNAAEAELAPPSLLGKRNAPESLTEAQFEAEHAKMADIRSAGAHVLMMYARMLQGVNAAGPRLGSNLGFAHAEIFEEAKKLLDARSTTSGNGAGSSSSGN